MQGQGAYKNKVNDKKTQANKLLKHKRYTEVGIEENVEQVLFCCRIFTALELFKKNQNDNSDAK